MDAGSIAVIRKKRITHIADEVGVSRKTVYRIKRNNT